MAVKQFHFDDFVKERIKNHEGKFIKKDFVLALTPHMPPHEIQREWANLLRYYRLSMTGWVTPTTQLNREGKCFVVVDFKAKEHSSTSQHI